MSHKKKVAGKNGSSVPANTISDSFRQKSSEQILAVIKGFSEFKDQASSAAEEYAAGVVRGVVSASANKEAFRDRMMAMLANIKCLDGELKRFGGAETLGRMDSVAILSTAKEKQMEKHRRKRAREETVYDHTSMLCPKCKLVRRDRLNINHMALDSVEAGSHFEFNYDNQCECSSHSDTDSDSSANSDASSRTSSRSTSSRDSNSHQ